MNFAKIIINDIEIKIPLSAPIYESLCDNSDQLESLPGGFGDLLKEIFPVAKQKANIIVGDAVLEFETERYALDYIADSYKNSSGINDDSLLQIDSFLRDTIPFKKRPPTNKQIDYITEIADILGLDIPKKALRNTELCSKFIDKHLDEFQTISRRNNKLKSEANRVARWAVAYSQSCNGVELKSIAKKLGIVQEVTIQKYLDKFSEWLGEYNKKNQSDREEILKLIIGVIEEDYYKLDFSLGVFDKDDH